MKFFRKMKIYIHYTNIKWNKKSTVVRHKRWSEDEVNSLIEELSEKLPKDEIAKRHQRSPKAIDSRIFAIIYQKHIEGLSNVEIEKITGISDEEIKIAIKHEGHLSLNAFFEKLELDNRIFMVGKQICETTYHKNFLYQAIKKIDPKHPPDYLTTS